MSLEGIIIKALSGFYYVRSEGQTYRCRARGRFRLDGQSPLVGDRVLFQPAASGDGTITALLPRRNFFERPAIANVDRLVMLVSAAIPVTDPYLIDMVTVQCEKRGCGVLLVVNKCDLDPGDALCAIYAKTLYELLRTSAATGEGVEALRSAIRGQVCCFTGNSGVGKSSLLNALDSRFALATGEISQKLGRGRHTTRHVELFDLGENTYIADTPGFATYDDGAALGLRKEELAALFPEFGAYTGDCRFLDCAHLAEPGCAVTAAVKRGEIAESRHRSYRRLYEQAARIKDWQLK